MEANQGTLTPRGMKPAARLFAGLVMCAALVACSAVEDSRNSTSAPESSTPTSVPVAIVLQGVPPASVTAGDAYSFEPTVSQGSGSIVFGIVGAPAWASFDEATGALAGTPGAGDVGTTAPITISASNGTSSASIGPFTIRVDAAAAPPPASSSAALSWSAPTENTDGTPLTNLAGYHIRYGTSAGDLSQTIDVAEAAATGYVVSGLASGTYYFSVSAYNTSGLEGPASTIGSKTL